MLLSVTSRPIEQNAGMKLRHVTRRTVPLDLQEHGGTLAEEVDVGPQPVVTGRINPWQITREVFDSYGATPGCAKCTDWSRGVRSTRKHNAACRDRFEQVLKNHPVYGPRIVQSTHRREHVEPVASMVLCLNM